MRVEALIKRRRNNLIFFAVLLAATLVSIIITEFEVTKAFTSIPRAIGWAVKSFYPNANSLEKIPKILVKLRETVLLSIASTTVAAIFAAFLALFGSKTTQINSFLAAVSRGIASIFRNIPVAAWALILLLSFGQSSLTGYFALFFATWGFLTRAFMETIDEVGSEGVEALKAVGASYFHIIFQAVIPSSLPQMISWVLFMVETNIRSSTLVGILTGTGIGFIFNLYYKSFQYNAASLVVVFIIISVLVIEYISNYVRRVIL
ncbi:MAG: Phosphonate ABC transporter permease protein PhnE2 [Firmicutes bacterium]|nr:Phosphonate ABC transporter permease protein PhnE2 [Bacillota bacterium]